MATITLRDKGPASIKTQGHRFARGVAERVNPDVARILEDDPRFLVSWDPGEKQVQGPVDTSTVAPRIKPVAVAAQHQAIRDAVEELDLNVESNWTTDGKPSAAALTKALGWQVTKHDRDEAMKATPAPKRPGGVVIRRKAPDSRVEATSGEEVDGVIGAQHVDATVNGAVEI